MTDERMERDDLVQRYLDGDLTPEEARLVRDLMSSDPGFQGDARAYRRIGDLLREMSGEGSDEAGVEASWGKVKERLGAGADGAVEAVGSPGPSPSVVCMSELARHRKRYWIPAAGLLAAAASVLVVLATESTVEEVPGALQDVAGMGSRVTDLSLGAASTMVMEVETGSGGTAAVLWVSGDDEEPAAAEDDDPAGAGAPPAAGAGEGGGV